VLHVVVDVVLRAIPGRLRCFRSPQVENPPRTAVARNWEGSASSRLALLAAEAAAEDIERLMSI